MRTRSARWWVAVAALAPGLLASSRARANGFEAPVDVDRPAPPSPDRVLPFPVVDEAVPTASAIGAKELPVDAVYLRAPDLLAGAPLKDASGAARRGFEGIVVRQSRVASGKVSIPPGGVGYLAEVLPSAAPLEGAQLGLFGGPRFVVDADLSIVMRKGVTLQLGEPTVLGSNVLVYSTHLPLAGTASAGLGSTSLAGFDWGRLGLGGFEVSLSQPAWHSKIFRDGLVQGRIEEITPAFVRLAWISGTRTESIVVAEEEVKAGRFKGGEDIPLDGGRHVKVTRVDASRRVTLETPDGAKTLAIDGDATRLVEDTDSRKKLIVLGKDYAVVCIPKLSDFPRGEAHLAVYAKPHVYRRGEALDVDAAWRVYPIALPTGHVLGVFIVNDKAVELAPDRATLAGPSGAFKLATTWTSGGELETFSVLDAKGGRSARVSAKGRTSIDMLAGGGPTIESLMARSGIAPPPDTEPPKADAAPAPAAAAPQPAAPSWRDDPVSFAKPHLAWTLGGAAAGFLLAALFGLMRRPRIGE